MNARSGGASLAQAFHPLPSSPVRVCSCHGSLCHLCRGERLTAAVQLVVAVLLRRGPRATPARGHTATPAGARSRPHGWHAHVDDVVVKVVSRPGAWIKLDGTGGAVICEVYAREEEVRIIGATRGSRTSLASSRARLGQSLPCRCRGARRSPPRLPFCRDAPGFLREHEVHLKKRGKNESAPVV